jgi:hypothetical protein
MIKRGNRSAMASGVDEIERLRREMHQVRLNLGDEVHDFVENARAMTDWRVHWRSHPWIGCAAALALGYLVVPSRRVGLTDARRLAEQAQAAAAGSPSSPARQILFKLGGMALGFAAQRGMQFLGQQIDHFVAARSHSTDEYSQETAGRHDQKQ